MSVHTFSAPDTGPTKFAGSVRDLAEPRTECAAGAKFIKGWEITNNGSMDWPADCELAYVSGDRLSASSSVSVGAISPGHSCYRAIHLRAPWKAGTYVSTWRLRSGDRFFGPMVPVQFIVSNHATSAGPTDCALNRRDRIAMNVSSIRPRDIEVIDEYRQVQQWLNEGISTILVTGGAGTGKSVLIQYLRNVIQKRVEVLAPTGVAALNVGGQTIHSFFHLPPRLVSPSDIHHIERNADHRTLGILVIDEISMVRADVLDAVDILLRRDGPNHRLPFGGVQVVMVGDLFQLPPVVKKNEEVALGERYSQPLFFASTALAQGVEKHIELQRSFGQYGHGYSALLKRLQVGRPTDDDFASLNSRVVHACPGQAAVLVPTNKLADQINDTQMAELSGRATTYRGAVTGDWSRRHDRAPAPMSLIIKHGARVMFVKNDPEKRWQNGSLGIVVAASPDHVRVQLDDTGRKVEVKRVSWKSYRHVLDHELGRVVPEVAGEYTQMPIAPAWALTIHRAQGRMLSAAHVDLEDVFAPGQTYVALSRVRRLDDLTLARPVTREQIRADERVRAYHDTLYSSRQCRPVTKARLGNDLPATDPRPKHVTRFALP